MEKIIFYVNVINGGGAARVMVNLSSQFADKGYEVVFVTSYKAEREYLLNSKIKRIVLEENPQQSRIRRNASRIIKLRRICKQEKADFLISFMGEPNFRAVVATIGLPIKTIISVRNDPKIEYGGPLMRFVGKHILPYADGCVFQTVDAQKWFPIKLQEKSAIIYNAVKPEFYQISRSPKKGLVVTCGRLEKQKNQKILIYAIHRLKSKYPFLKLKIYGEGSQKAELTKLISDLNLQKTVILEGQTDKVGDALKNADIFVLTSDFEGMPNALMEALAVGVPCIATDCPCGGAKMLIEDGHNGLLIPVNDVEALVKAFETMLNNDELKSKISDNSRKAAKNYTADKIYQQWETYMRGI